MSHETEIKIKCRYCELKDTCSRRSQKEKFEKAGWMTSCRLTPNRPSKKKKKKKK